MVAPTSFFSDYGGHIRILEETLALEALGHSVNIVTYYKGNDVPGLKIHRTAALPYHTDYEVGSSRHKLAFDLFLALKTHQVGFRLRPDVVHGHMHEGALIGGSLARLLRVPLIFDFQGGLTGEMVDHGFLDPDGRVYPWVRWLEKFICHMPQAILTSSLRAQDLLTQQFGVRDDRIQPLPDCVDLQRFDRARFSEAARDALRRHLGIPPGHLIVAYLGLLADYQGTPDLIEAAARLKAAGEKIHFLIMGYPRVDYYKAVARAKRVDDYITFTGKVGYSEAPFYLSLGDIAISAKLSATEGSGKVLNYMAMSQPVVAYDTPVHREYLAELGSYAPAGNVEALAQAIQELAHHPGRQSSIGRALRQRAAEKFSWPAAAHQISDLYYRLTER
jgi:glycosyltransferase involved in cell wall biosynthesis